MYAAYLPSGTPTQLTLAAGTYDVRWYNPRAGGPLLTGSVSQIVGPGPVSTGMNPAGDNRDWVVLVTAETPAAGSVLPYGSGKLSSIGTTPFFTWIGEPNAGQSLRIQIRDGIPYTPGFMFWGVGQQSSPFFGGTLLVASPLTRMRVISLNAWGVGQYTVEPDSSMIGTQRNYQFWGRDPGYAPPRNVMLTNGLEVLFGSH